MPFIIHNNASFKYHFLYIRIVPADDSKSWEYQSSKLIPSFYFLHQKMFIYDPLPIYTCWIQVILYISFQRSFYFSSTQ